MSLLELERLDVRKMTLLLGPMAGMVGIMGNIIMDFLKEDELYELWIDFYNRTYMIWQDSGETPT